MFTNGSWLQNYVTPRRLRSVSTSRAISRGFNCSVARSDLTVFWELSRYAAPHMVKMSLYRLWKWIAKPCRTVVPPFGFELCCIYESNGICESANLQSRYLVSSRKYFTTYTKTWKANSSVKISLAQRATSEFTWFESCLKTNLYLMICRQISFGCFCFLSYLTSNYCVTNSH